MESEINQAANAREEVWREEKGKDIMDFKKILQQQRTEDKELEKEVIR